MALIQVTPDLLTSKANELRSYKDQHDEAMNKMRTLVMGLNEIWKGDAQTAFLAKYECLSKQSRYSAQLAEMLEAVGMSNTSPILNEDGTPNLAASRRVVFRFLIDLDTAASN